MPEVPRIREQPHEHHGPGRQQGPGIARGRALETGDHEGRRQHRQRRCHTGKRGRGAEQHGGGDDAGHAGQAHHHAHRLSERLKPARAHHEQTTGGQFPRPRRHQVEGGQRLVGGAPHAERERRHQDDGKEGGRSGHHAPLESAGAGDQRGQDQRPHHIELLFDGKRPRVEQRQQFELWREVAVGLVPEEEVGVEEQRRHARCRCQRRLLAGEAHKRHDRHGEHDNDDEGGENSADAAGVEIAEIDAAVPPRIVEQQPADQETRNDEEDVDADETARKGGDAGVVGDDEPDGDGTQAVNARPVGRLRV